MSKDSLVKGTIILTVAALVARFLGVFQRIPLVYLLGDEGMGSYSIAFNLYSVLLVVATAGIPSALSKMISERIALGRHEEADRIYRAAILFAVVAGIIAAGVLFALSEWFAAGVSKDPMAILATQAVAPGLLLFPIIAVMRGYFQGRQHMMPNGVSQVVEQIFRLVVAVGLAYALLSVSHEWAIAGASFGGVAGGVAALGVMIYYTLKLKRKDAGEASSSAKSVTADTKKGAKQPASNTPVLTSYGSIYGALLKLSIPIVIFSITVTLVYSIDSSSVIPLLQDKFTTDGARELLGILGGRAQSLAGIPIILAIALSQSVVPLISSSFSRGEMDHVKHHTSRVLQLSILTGLPMVLLIVLAARPLDGFIFGYEKSVYGYENAPYIIGLLTISAMFQIIMQTSGAVLMGMGRMKPLMLAVVVGVGAKVALNYILAPSLDIYGIVLATMTCFIIMSFMNIRVLHKAVPFKVFSSRRWIGLIVSTIVICAVGFGLEYVTHTYLHPFGIDRLNEGLNASIVSIVVIAMYPLMLMLTKVVTKEDVRNLPGPIQKIIGKVSRITKRGQASS
ncbi:polysaccharide biosynthesis protein [Paenibacillus sp. N1-5-1-14]|uniref:putative polysaccharide biosynthesis protein n=1 Tax=Paenibacillus radicibacter TaxID=2972488 RepID=UPI00215963D4|nr:polysaccharide biosynthesis protein [Paenibacillus radicibacter]MCR8645296.1 polysaccharide biosynthesis protein [Paenibacillus radicibacter]